MTVAEQFGFTLPPTNRRTGLERYGDQEISQFRGSGDDRREVDLSREDMESSRWQPREGVRGHPRRALRQRDLRRRDLHGRSRVDEGPRESSLEKMAGLKALVDGGRLTAAMASQISDGASAVLLASEKAVRAHNLKPRARIHHISTAAPIRCSC